MPTALEDALKTACQRRHLSTAGARLIHHYSNAVYLLPAEQAIARISVGAEDQEVLQTTQTVTQWLVTEHDFPAAAPLPGVELVAVEPRLVVTFWIYYQQPEHPPQLNSAHLGELLAKLHRAGDPPVKLRPWVPLESLAGALRAPDLGGAISEQERDWLLQRVADTREELAALEWPLGHGLIHGDAWSGNLLWSNRGASRALLCDWDRVSCGPREIDLIPTWHATIRYGRGPDWLSDFIKQYGYDLATWPGYDALVRLRDLAQLPGPLRRATSSPKHAAALRQRFEAIRDGHRPGPWTAL